MASTTPRYGTTAGRDNTGRNITQDYQTPAYATPLAVAPTTQKTLIKPATLTGALTINATTTNASVDDDLTFIFTSDGTGRVVTFGTNFVSTGTLTLVASKQGSASFKFDGVKYIETGRAIQP